MSKYESVTTFQITEFLQSRHSLVHVERSKSKTCTLTGAETSLEFCQKSNSANLKLLHVTVSLIISSSMSLLNMINWWTSVWLPWRTGWTDKTDVLVIASDRKASKVAQWIGSLSCAIQSRCYIWSRYLYVFWPTYQIIDTNMYLPFKKQF